MMYAIIEAGAVLGVASLETHEVNESMVYIGELFVGTGDEYRDGVFYRNGQRVLSASEKLDEAQHEMEDMRAALINLGVTIDG